MEILQTLFRLIENNKEIKNIIKYNLNNHNPHTTDFLNFRRKTFTSDQTRTIQQM